MSEGVVDVAAVTEADHEQNQFLVADRVGDTVGADANLEQAGVPGERLDPGQRYCAASGDSGDEPGLHRAVALPQQSGGGVASAAWFGARSDRCSYQGIIEAPAGGRRNDLRGRLPRCLPRRVRSIRSIRVRSPSTHPREERPEDCPGRRSHG